MNRRWAPLVLFSIRAHQTRCWVMTWEIYDSDGVVLTLTDKTWTEARRTRNTTMTELLHNRWRRLLCDAKPCASPFWKLCCVRQSGQYHLLRSDRWQTLLCRIQTRFDNKVLCSIVIREWNVFFLQSNLTNHLFMYISVHVRTRTK